MKVLDVLDERPQGVVQIDSVDREGNIISSVKHNMVVNNARTIIRDLLNSPSNSLRLNVLQLGTMNKVYGDPTSDLPKPTIYDTALIAPYFNISAAAHDTLIISSRPALRLTFNIGADSANDANPTVMNKLITELGLFTEAGGLFSRLVLPIIKTRDIGLNIYWTIAI